MHPAFANARRKRSGRAEPAAQRGVPPEAPPRVRRVTSWSRTDVGLQRFEEVSVRRLLNSQEFLELSGGARVAVEDVHFTMSTHPPDITLVARRDGEALWQARLAAFEPDHSSGVTDVDSVDYRALYWEAARLVVVAGDEQAYLLDAQDGSVRRELRLGSRASSFDFVAAFVLRGVPMAVIACSKVVRVVDLAAEVVGEHWFRGPVTAVREGRPGELVISYYDVDTAEVPLVDWVVDLKSVVAH